MRSLPIGTGFVSSKVNDRPAWSSLILIMVHMLTPTFGNSVSHGHHSPAALPQFIEQDFDGHVGTRRLLTVAGANATAAQVTFADEMSLGFLISAIVFGCIYCNGRRGRSPRSQAEPNRAGLYLASWSGGCTCVALVGLIFCICVDGMLTVDSTTGSSLVDPHHAWDCTEHGYTRCWHDHRTAGLYYGWVGLVVIGTFLFCCTWCVAYTHFVASETAESHGRYERSLDMTVAEQNLRLQKHLRHEQAHDLAEVDNAIEVLEDAAKHIDIRKNIDVKLREASMIFCTTTLVIIVPVFLWVYLVWRAANAFADVGSVDTNMTSTEAIGNHEGSSSRFDLNVTFSNTSSVLDLLLAPSSYAFLTANCSSLSRRYSADAMEPMAAFFFNESCLRAVDVSTGNQTCTVRKANAFFIAFMSNWRIEAQVGNVFALVSLIVLMQLGGIPRPADVPGKVLWALWMGCQVGQLLLVIFALALVVLGYLAGQQRFNACMVQVQLPSIFPDWLSGLSLLTALFASAGIFHPMVITKVLTLLVYSSACFHSIIAWEDSNPAEGFGFSLLAGEFFGRTLARFVALLACGWIAFWAVALCGYGILTSLMYLPVAIATPFWLFL